MAGNRVQYIIEMIADDHKIRQQMAKWDWEDIMGAKGEGFSDLLKKQSKDGRQQIIDTLSGLNIDWAKTLGIGQLEQVLRRSLSNKRIKLDGFIKDGDTEAIQKIVDNVVDLGNAMSELGSEFQAKSLVKGLESLMSVLKPVSEKFDILADAPKAVEAAFNKAFNSSAIHGAEQTINKIATAMASLGVDKSAVKNMKQVRSEVEKLAKESKTIKIDIDYQNLSDVDLLSVLRNKHNKKTLKLDELLNLEWGKQLETVVEAEGEKLKSTLMNIVALESKIKSLTGKSPIGEDFFDISGYDGIDDIKETLENLTETVDKSVKETVRKLDQGVKNIQQSITEKLGQLTEVNISLTLDEENKTKFKNSIDSFVSELNEQKHGEINSVKVDLELNEPKKTTKRGRPNDASKEQIEETKVNIQKELSATEEEYNNAIKVLEQLNKKYEEEKSKDKEYDKGPKSATLKGHINKAEEEITALKKTMTSYQYLLDNMDDYEFAKSVISDWKKFSSAAQNIRISQDKLLTDTRKWRNEMNESLKFKYQWRIEGTEDEFDRLSFALTDISERKPIQLMPDIDFLADAIEAGLSGREINVKLAADGPIKATGGVVGNLGVVPVVPIGGIATQSTPRQQPNRIKQDSVPQQQEPRQEEVPQSSVDVDAEIDEIIKFVENQIEINRKLKESYAELLKDAGITDKEVSAYVTNVKNKKTEVPADVIKKYGTESIFLNRLSKTKEQVHFNEKLSFFSAAKSILGLKDVVTSSSDEAQVKEASEQIKSLLVNSIVDSFKSYINTSKERFEKNEADIKTWEATKDTAVKAYGSDEEKKIRLDKVLAQEKVVSELESNTAIKEYSNLLELIQEAKKEGDTESYTAFLEQERNTLPSVKQGYQELIEARKKLITLKGKDSNDKNLLKAIEAEQNIARLTRQNEKITRSRQEYEAIGFPLSRLEGLIGAKDNKGIYDLIVGEILSKPNIVQSMGARRKTSDMINPIYLFDTTAQKLLTATVDMVQKALSIAQKTTDELDRRAWQESALGDMKKLAKKKSVLNSIGGWGVEPKSQEDFQEIKDVLSEDFERLRQAKEYHNLLEDIKQARQQKDQQLLDVLLQKKQDTPDDIKEIYRGIVNKTNDKDVAYLRFDKALDKAISAANNFREIYELELAEDKESLLTSENDEEWFKQKYSDPVEANNKYLAYTTYLNAVKELQGLLHSEKPNAETGAPGKFGVLDEITRQLRGYIFRVTLVDDKGSHIIDVGTQKLVEDGKLNKPEKQYQAGKVPMVNFLKSLSDDFSELVDIRFYKTPSGRGRLDQPVYVEPPVAQDSKKKQDNSHSLAEAKRTIALANRVVDESANNISAEEELDTANQILEVTNQTLESVNTKISNLTGGVDPKEYRESLLQQRKNLQTVTKEDSVSAPLSSVFVEADKIIKDATAEANVAREIAQNPFDNKVQKLFKGDLPESLKRLSEVIRQREELDQTLPASHEEAVQRQSKYQELLNEERALRQSINQWADEIGNKKDDAIKSANEMKQNEAPNVAKEYQKKLGGLADQAISLSQQLDADPNNESLQIQLADIVSTISDLTISYKAFLNQYGITTKGFLGNENQKKLDAARKIYENPSDKSLWGNFDKVPESVQKAADLVQRDSDLFTQLRNLPSEIVEINNELDRLKSEYDNAQQAFDANPTEANRKARERAKLAYKTYRNKNESRRDALLKEYQEPINQERARLAREYEAERKKILQWVTRQESVLGDGDLAGLGNSGKKFKTLQDIVSKWKGRQGSSQATTVDTEQERDLLNNKIRELSALESQKSTEEQLKANAEERVRLAQRQLDIEKELADVNTTAERKSELETEYANNKTRAVELGAKARKFATQSVEPEKLQWAYLELIDDAISRQEESDKKLREINSSIERDKQRLGRLEAERTPEAVAEGKRHTQDAAINHHIQVLAEDMVTRGVDARKEQERLKAAIAQLESQLGNEQFSQQRYVNNNPVGYKEGWNASQLKDYVQTLPVAQEQGFDFEEWLMDRYGSLTEQLKFFSDNPNKASNLPILKDFVVISKALEEVTGQEWLKPFVEKNTLAFRGGAKDPYEAVTSFIQSATEEQNERILSIENELSTTKGKLRRTNAPKGFADIYKEAEEENPITNFYDYQNPHMHQQQAILNSLKQKAIDYQREHITSEEMEKAISDSIEALKKLIEDKEAESKAEREHNKSITAERDRLKAEGKITDEMIEARRNATEEIRREAQFVHRNADTTTRMANTYETYYEDVSDREEYDTHYQNYTGGQMYQYGGGSYSVTVPGVATEDTLWKIYQLLSGDTSERGLSDTERYALEAELDDIRSQFGDGGLGRNTGGYKAPKDRDPTDLDIGPVLFVADDVKAKLIEQFGKALPIEELRAIVGDAAIDLFTSTGDPSRKVDRHEFYEQNYDAIVEKAISESKKRIEGMSQPTTNTTTEPQYGTPEREVFEHRNQLASTLGIEYLDLATTKYTEIDSEIAELLKITGENIFKYIDKFGVELSDADKIAELRNKYVQMKDETATPDLGKRLYDIINTVFSYLKHSGVDVENSSFVQENAKKWNADLSFGNWNQRETSFKEWANASILDNDSVKQKTEKSEKQPDNTKEEAKTDKQVAVDVKRIADTILTTQMVPNGDLDYRAETMRGTGYGITPHPGGKEYKYDPWQTARGTVNNAMAFAKSVFSNFVGNAREGNFDDINKYLQYLGEAEKKLLLLDKFFESLKGVQVKDKSSAIKELTGKRDAYLQEINELREIISQVSSTEAQQAVFKSISTHMPKLAFDLSEKSAKEVLDFDTKQPIESDIFEDGKFNAGNVYGFLVDLGRNFQEIESAALYFDRMGDAESLKKVSEVLSYMGRAMAIFNKDFEKIPNVRDKDFNAPMRDKRIEEGKYLRELINGLLSKHGVDASVVETPKTTQEAKEVSESLMTIGKAINIINNAIGGSTAKTTAGMAKAYANKIHDNAEAVEAAKLLYNTPDSELTTKFGKNTKAKLKEFRDAWHKKTTDDELNQQARFDMLNKKEAEKPKVQVEPEVAPGAVAKEVKENVAETPAKAEIVPQDNTLPDGFSFVGGSEEGYEELLAFLNSQEADVDIVPDVQPGSIDEAIDEEVATNPPTVSTVIADFADGFHFEGSEEMFQEMVEALGEPIKKTIVESGQQLENESEVIEQQFDNIEQLKAREEEIKAKLAQDDKLRAAQSSDKAPGGIIGAMNELAKDNTLREILTAIGEIAKRQTSFTSGKGNSAQDLLLRLQKMLEIGVDQKKERVSYIDLATGAMTDSIEGANDIIDSATFNALRKAYQDSVNFNAQVHTHADADDPYFSSKDLTQFADDVKNGITKQILLSKNNMTVLDMANVSDISGLLDALAQTEHNFDELAATAEKFGATYISSSFSDMTPQGLVKMLGIKGVESKYTEAETRDSAVSGVLAEDAKEAADMLQESTGRAIKKTVERVGAELMTITEKTDAKGNKTWSNQINNKYEKAAIATNKAIEKLELGDAFGVGTEAQLALDTYKAKYSQFIDLVNRYKQNPKQDGIQEEFNTLLPELDEAENKLNKLIAAKDKFMGNKDPIRIFDQNQIDVAGTSLKGLATELFAGKIGLGDNMAFNGLSETPNGMRLLVDVLKNGTINQYALEVDKATGQVKEFMIAETALANAFQNVNKAMRYNETVMANVAIGDNPTQQEAFMSAAKSPEWNAYKKALADMEKYVANIWNRMANGGRGASKKELDYIMTLSENVLALGKNVQKTSVDFKNFWKQNPDDVTALKFKVKGGKNAPSRDEQVRAELERLAQTKASASGDKYSFASFDNNTLRYKLTDLEGNIRNVAMVWSELYGQVATISDKAVSGIDKLVSKVEKLKEKFADAQVAGYLNVDDANLKEFESQLEAINNAVANGEAFERIEEMRKNVIAIGDTINKTINKNKGWMVGTGAKKQTENQYNKIYGAIQAGELDTMVSEDSSVLKEYLKAYKQLNIDYETYVKSNEINNPKIQQQIQQKANAVQILGKRLLSSVQHADELKKKVEQSGTYKNTSTGEEIGLGGSTSVTTTELDNLQAKMRDFVQNDLRQANIEGVKFDAVNQKMVYTFRISKDAVADMAVEYNDATKALYAYQLRERESLTGLKGFMQSMRGKMKSILQYTTSITSIYRVWGTLRQGITYIREIDSALTELRKVTDETEKTYDRFLNTAAKTADKVGSTIKEIVSSTADWARIGYSLQDATTLAESTAVLLNVSEFQSIDEATSALTSTLQAFGYTANQSMEVVDVMNEVGKLVARR